MQKIIGYGRISPHSRMEPVSRKKQLAAIRNQIGNHPVDFEVDAVVGDTPLVDRPVLGLQLLKAQSQRVPLVVENLDRIVSTYDSKLIENFDADISKFRVQVAVARDNPPMVRSIHKLLKSSKSDSWKHKRLVPLVHQYFRWRMGNVIDSEAKPEQEEPPSLPYKSPQAAAHLPGVESCTENMLKLEGDCRGSDWLLYGYMGAAFQEHWEALCARRGIAPGGQPGYGERTGDVELFRAIQRLEEETQKTIDGRLKLPSNQHIADALNAYGFTNLRGTQFSRKTVWEIRRSGAYLGWILEESTVGLDLPAVS